MEAVTILMETETHKDIINLFPRWYIYCTKLALSSKILIPSCIYKNVSLSLPLHLNQFSFIYCQ